MKRGLFTGMLAGSMLALAAIAGCGDKCTDETFDKINLGMNLDQVEDLMGGAGESEDRSGSTISSGGVMGGSKEAKTRTYSWKSGQKQVIVELKDDKVVRKQKVGF